MRKLVAISALVLFATSAISATQASPPDPARAREWAKRQVERVDKDHDGKVTKKAAKAPALAAG